MTLIKQCFQSVILRTVNSTSSLNFVQLAENNGTLRFKDNIVFKPYDSPGDAVTNTVGGPDRFCRI